MRKILLISILALSVVYHAALLDHLPKKYDFFAYTYDAQKLFEAFKSTDLGKALLEDLGLGEVVSSMLDQMGIDPDVLKEIKEVLLVGREDGQILLAFGPFNNPSDVAYVIGNLITSSTGETNPKIEMDGKEYTLGVEAIGDYVAVYVGEELLNDFSRGGGVYEKDEIYEREGAIGFGQAHTKDFDSYSVVYTTDDSIQTDVKIYPKEWDPARAKPFVKLTTSEIPSGDLVLILNTRNFKEVASDLEDSFGDILDELDINLEDTEELPESVFIAIGVDLNEYIAAGIQESVSGESVEISETPRLIIHVITDKSFDLEADTAKNCERVSGNTYDCEDLMVKHVSKHEAIATSKSGKPSGNARSNLTGMIRGDEFFLLAWDTTGALEPLGLDVSTTLIGRGWVEGDHVRLHFQIK